jgi:predicted DsbA family dithiol-disulfide isomerase
VLVGASIRSHGWRLPPFQADVASEAVKKVVGTDTAEARKLGVTGAPAFFVNGRFLRGAHRSMRSRR